MIDKSIAENNAKIAELENKEILKTIKEKKISAQELNITEVSITPSSNSIFLKSISYIEMYEYISKNRVYNLKMIDGALITMQYRFRSNILINHRLSFFPSPDLEAFQNEPELYIDDELYADILDKRIVTVPFRFDFDSTEGSYRHRLYL